MRSSPTRRVSASRARAAAAARSSPSSASASISSPWTARYSASAVATLTIPIYEGGQVYSRTRQAKETAGQRRIEVDTSRDTVRAAVVSAWGSHEAAKAQITAA